MSGLPYECLVTSEAPIYIMYISLYATKGQLQRLA